MIFHSAMVLSGTIEVQVRQTGGMKPLQMSSFSCTDWKCKVLSPGYRAIWIAISSPSTDIGPVIKLRPSKCPLLDRTIQ